MAGFPVYVALRPVISITPLLNVHPPTAALRDRGGKGWFGQVSQESAGGNGSGLDGEREGAMAEQLCCTVRGQPQHASFPPSKPTIHFPEMSRVEARAYHALMEGLFWHREPGISQTGWGRTHLSSCFY